MNEFTITKILSIDIGGSNIKAALLNGHGEFIQPYEKLPTPSPATPAKVLDTIKKLANKFAAFDEIAVGFPGYVNDGVVKTAPNLGTGSWINFNLQKKLANLLGKPALVINDADLQGLSLAKGKGLEMMITLGTGFGTALLKDGMLLPHLELAHHPVSGKKTYDEYIGEAALKKIGLKKWNKRMTKVLGILKVVFNYDHLYISGGNSGLLSCKLEKNITIAGNREGIKGGAMLWKQHKWINHQNIFIEDKNVQVEVL